MLPTISSVKDATDGRNPACSSIASPKTCIFSINSSPTRHYMLPGSLLWAHLVATLRVETLVVTMANAALAKIRGRQSDRPLHWGEGGGGVTVAYEHQGICIVAPCAWLAGHRL